MSDPFGARAAPVRFPKNNKFAEHLAGRFFVPGVSGGFRKTRSTDAFDGDQAANRKAVIEAINDCNQTQKLKRMRRDARRLLSLERKRLKVTSKMKIMCSTFVRKLISSWNSTNF
jgi:hypothetical protein